jgi:hypothetical protein
MKDPPRRIVTLADHIALEQVPRGQRFTEENRSLKKLLAEQMLDAAPLREMLVTDL